MRRDEIAVVGAGLAGTVLVEALVARGLERLVWFDAPASGRGSDSPCALVQPFAGRSFAPRPGSLQAFATARRWLQGLPAAAEVHTARLRRRMPDDAAGRRLARSWQTHGEALRAQWDGSLRLDEDPDGVRVLEYGPVFGVRLPAALAAMHARLATRGHVAQPRRVRRLSPRPDGWSVELDDDTAHEAAIVVVAAGEGARALLTDHADVADLEHVEGCVRFGAAPPLDPFVVERGHVVGTRTCVGWGASYRSCDGDDDRDHVGQLDAIEARLRPHAASWPVASSTWCGVRVVDRRQRVPWSGIVAPRLIAMTAFGSQGGLWIPATSERLAAQLQAMSSR